jgi:interferon gamma-inducible protein 30
MKIVILIIIYLTTISFCEKPVIDVFVESLCPDCMDFIGGSFKNFNSYQDKDTLAIVNFYPYGNAAEKWNGQKWDFTCQHGSNECYGNTVENCALSFLDKSQGHDFLICIEGNIRSFSKDFEKTLAHCIDDKSLRAEILNCASSDEGNKLQHEAAQKTPAHDYVPWVHVNGEHDKEVENKILSNMLDYLCELQGKDCSQHQSSFKAQAPSNKCLNIRFSEDLKFLQE